MGSGPGEQGEPAVGDQARQGGKRAGGGAAAPRSAGYGPRGGPLRNLEGCAEDRPPRDERGVGAALTPPGKACPSASRGHAHRCPVGPAGVLTLGQSSSWARVSWAIRRVCGTVSTAPQLAGTWHTRARCPMHTPAPPSALGQPFLTFTSGANEARSPHVLSVPHAHPPSLSSRDDRSKPRSL